MRASGGDSPGTGGPKEEMPVAPWRHGSTTSRNAGVSVRQPHFAGRHEVGIHEVHHDGEPHAGVAPLPRAQSRERHRQNCKNQAHRRKSDAPVELSSLVGIRGADKVLCRLCLDIFDHIRSAVGTWIGITCSAKRTILNCGLPGTPSKRSPSYNVIVCVIPSAVTE